MVTKVIKDKPPKKLKCTICEESFLKEETIIKSQKRYCKTCLEIKEEESALYKNDWDLLFEYICKLYNIDKPTGMMFQQMKNYRADYEYTNIGMYYTLQYYYKILENEVLEDTGLGIIPYFYDKAKNHYNRMFNLQDIAEEFKGEEKSVQIKTKIADKISINKNPLPLNFDWEEYNEDN